MSDSKPEVYLHFVWTTRLRQPTIPARLERATYRVIEGEVKRLSVGCRTMSICSYASVVR